MCKIIHFLSLHFKNFYLRRKKLSIIVLFFITCVVEFKSTYYSHVYTTAFIIYHYTVRKIKKLPLV